MDDLAAAVADLTRQMTLLTGIVQRVMDGFDELLARLGGIENRLGGVENRLGGVENRLETIEGRLS